MRAAKPVGEARQLPPDRLHAALGQAAQVRRRRGQVRPRGKHILGDQLAGDARRCCPDIGHEVSDQNINLMPHGGHHRQCRLVHGAGQHLLVERPKILQAPAASCQQNQIQRLTLPGAPLVQPVNRLGHFRCGCCALHTARLQHNLQGGVAPQNDMQHIPNRRAGRRGDKPDPRGKTGQRSLAPGREQALGLQLALQFLKLDLQLSTPLQFHLANNQLILPPRLKQRDVPLQEHLCSVLNQRTVLRVSSAKQRATQLAFLILDAEINVTRGLSSQAGDLPLHPDGSELIFQQALGLSVQLGNAINLARLPLLRQSAEVPQALLLPAHSAGNNSETRSMERALPVSSSMSIKAPFSMTRLEATPKRCGR